MPSKIGAEKARIKLVNKYGEDAFKINGSKGGSVKSDAKKLAAREREAKKKAQREAV